MLAEEQRDQSRRMKMAENMTEDEARDKAREILGLNSVGGGGG